MGCHHGDDANGHGQLTRYHIGDESIVVVRHVQQLGARDVGEIGTRKVALRTHPRGAVGEFSRMGFCIINQVMDVFRSKCRVNGKDQGSSP